MPPVYKGRAGFELGRYRPQTTSRFSLLFNAGIAKSLGSPVVGIAGLRLKGYLGTIAEDLDGGGRALFEIPSFYTGFGIDYLAGDSVADFCLPSISRYVAGGFSGVAPPWRIVGSQRGSANQVMYSRIRWESSLDLARVWVSCHHRRFIFRGRQHGVCK